MTAAAVAFRGARSGGALSEEGRFVATQVTQLWDRFEETISLQAPQSELFADLENLAAEHSLPGWDGNVAPAISYDTLRNAGAFISALPPDLPPPELTVEPSDASIGFEWHGGYRRVFAVSIGDSGRLACSGLDGADQWHAALGFDGEIPGFVLESVRRVCA